MDQLQLRLPSENRSTKLNMTKNQAKKVRQKSQHWQPKNPDPGTWNTKPS